MRTLVQCDFDGTITQEDVSFQLLDAFADGDWRQLLDQYRQNKISVGAFNSRAFTMVNADKRTLIDFVRRNAEIRDGLPELLSCCRRKGFQFVIVSNGLDFYIDTILRDMEIENIEVFAAQTRFGSQGIEAKYIGPDGQELQSDFKEVYTRLFLSRGYRVIYVGNGTSDVLPARLANLIFATGELLGRCQEMKLNYIPFFDLTDVAEGLELLR